MSFSFQALSLEVVVFEKKITLPKSCTLATKHKKLLIEGSLLTCSFEDQSNLELTIDGECNFQFFMDSLNESDEKLAIDYKENEVRYMEFHLKDRYKNTPIYSRVIMDPYSCLIITGTSLSSISEKTEPLWFKLRK